MRGWRSWMRRSAGPRPLPEPRPAVEHNPCAPGPTPKPIGAGDPREALAPRPIAVWLLLLLLSGLVALLAFRSAHLVWKVFSDWKGPGVGGGVALALAIAWSAAVPVALSLTVLAIFARKPWGRWIGAALILGLAAFSFMRPGTSQYANEAQRAGAFLARTFILPLLCVWWCHAFAFSAKARRYFARTTAGPA